jgi:peptidyl-prolyl cis-trans isomerase SurA
VAAIIRITARNEGHRANINNDYQIIKQMAENARQQRMVDDWLQEKIGKTYVRIDPDWQGCEYKYKGWLK